MSWEEVAGPSGSWGAGSAPSTVWDDLSRSDTTARHASRFVAATPSFGSSSIDFYLAFTASNPALFTEIDPKAFSATTSNEP